MKKLRVPQSVKTVDVVTIVDFIPDSAPVPPLGITSQFGSDWDVDKKKVINI